MGEWLIPPDCKSGALTGYVGSNPTRSTKITGRMARVYYKYAFRLCIKILILAHIAQW